MDITAIHTARVIAWVPPEELDPYGHVNASQLSAGLVERYGFSVAPKTYEDWNLQKGTRFREGRWENVGITELAIFSNGIVVDTRSSTDDSERILRDLISWGSQRFGPPFQRAFRTSFFSDLTFHSQLSLAALNPVIGRLAERLSEHANGHLPRVEYELTGIAFNIDLALYQPRGGPFRIERRDNVPFRENRYYSSAPVRTQQHLQLLEELERCLLRSDAAGA